MKWIFFRKKGGSWQFPGEPPIKLLEKKKGGSLQKTLRLPRTPGEKGKRWRWSTAEMLGGAKSIHGGGKKEGRLAHAELKTGREEKTGLAAVADGADPPNEEKKKGPRR